MTEIDMLLYFITPDDEKTKTNLTNTNELALESALAKFKAAKERDVE